MKTRSLYAALLVLVTSGCYTWEYVRPADLSEIVPRDRPTQVRYAVHGVFSYSSMSSPTVQGDSLRGIVEESVEGATLTSTRAVAMRDISSAEIRTLDGVATASIAAAGALTIIGIIALLALDDCENFFAGC